MYGRAQAKQAYKQTITETEEPREIERKVFLQITGELERAARENQTPLSPAALDALGRNQKLWGELMFDCAYKDNPLPDSLKAGIISLALFVDRHTPYVISGEKTIAPLLEINRNIIKGLAGVSPEPEQLEEAS
ncbi:MAG: flagellar biosynthesis regulator FlaF [Parvularculaceae bacterium]|nr:flagellar biosynthesis regulator FlaF [Parvularculaceae bacterium]